MAFSQYLLARSCSRRAVVAVACALAALTLGIGPRAVADVQPQLLAATTTTTTTTPPQPHSVPSYWLVASDGGVFSFGMPFYGSMGGKHLDKPVVGMSPTADSGGYWLVASDGGIFSFGDAAFYGSMGAKPLWAPVVGMATDPVTGGYWLVASDGGIFSFGAPFFGSMGGKPLDKPVVGMAATPDGGGYWLFASDGGVFCFGDATFHGSMGGKSLAKPVVGASRSADGGGYWLVASDGGIFSFGDATFQGSLGGQPLVHPVAAMTTADGGGYWMTDDNGAVTAFGDAGYWGSAPQHLAAAVVGMADGPGTGGAAGNPYQSGAYGYDVSSWNCGNLPSGHAIGIVKAYQWGYPNNCLAQEAAWAGAGLNLYLYLVGGTQATNEPSCAGTYATSCNFGYAQATAAYGYAKSTSGVDPDVAWWIDVEATGSNWSSDTAANAAVVAGAITGLRDEGINNVGIYTSPDNWNGIVGRYQPAVALWIAWYTRSGPYDCQNLASYAQKNNDLLPTGPLFVVQYTDQANGQSLDGDYAC